MYQSASLSPSGALSLLLPASWYGRQSLALGPLDPVARREEDGSRSSQCGTSIGSMFRKANSRGRSSGPCKENELSSFFTTKWKGYPHRYVWPLSVFQVFYMEL